MIKIAGMAAVIIAGSILGAVKSAELSDRVSELDRAKNALAFLQSEMEITGKLLCDILKESRYSLFCTAASIIEEKGVAKGFKEAVIKSKLPPEEKRIFMGFGEGLAAQDSIGQIKNIKLCSERVTALKKQREENQKNLGKLYTAAGVLGSTALAIIFI